MNESFNEMLRVGDRGERKEYVEWKRRAGVKREKGEEKSKEGAREAVESAGL